MVCPSCGANNLDGSRFCIKCGKELPKFQPQPQPQFQPRPQSAASNSSYNKPNNNQSAASPAKNSNQSLITAAIAIGAALIIALAGLVVYKMIPMDALNEKLASRNEAGQTGTETSEAVVEEVQTGPAGAPADNAMSAGEQADSAQQTTTSSWNNNNNTNSSNTSRKYSDEELIEKAEAYYYAHYQVYPPVIDVDHYEGSDVVLHLYEFSPAGNTATYDWYTIDPNTLKGTNFMGEYIDLNDLSAPATSQYILPGSDTRYLSKNELYGMTADECRLARNEIYARHGRMFDSADLQQYFYGKSWYQPIYSPEEFQENWLNDYEMYNRDLIVEYEKECGYR